MLRTLEPDIVLLQEWDDADRGEDIAAWFERHLPPGTPGSPAADARWRAAVGLFGVGIASPHPMTPLDGVVETDGAYSGEPGREVRFRAALVEPQGGPRVLAASVHLKCCGTAGSREDLLRMDEATAVARRVAELVRLHGPDMVVVGGDLNLVGSRPPIEMLASGTDADGSDLAIARPMVLGRREFYTWWDEGNRFAPGRLDWVLYSDATAAAEGFVLDSSRFDAASLESAGLGWGDTRTSDHLPVVVDLRRR